MSASFDRREFLTGFSARRRSQSRHVSSVLVHVLPHQRNAVIDRISRMAGAEIHGETKGKIVVVLEASDAGEIGERVLQMSQLEGVIAASLVYEQSYEEDGETAA